MNQNSYFRDSKGNYFWKYEKGNGKYYSKFFYGYVKIIRKWSEHFRTLIIKYIELDANCESRHSLELICYKQKSL